MDYIHKLPFIVGIVVTLAVGAMSYVHKVDGQVLYLRMALSLIVFYILGVYMRSVLVRTLKEIELRKREEELMEREEEEKKRAEEEEKKNFNTTGDAASSGIDYKVDGDEEFSPLNLSKVVKDKMDS